MTLPAAFAEVVSSFLGSPIRRTSSVGGGCIANATRLDTDAGVFFLKYGHGAVAHTFPAEAAGLHALRSANSPLVIPDVLAVGEETAEQPGFLLLAWVETGPPRTGFWDAFGQGLANLHQHEARHYGFDQDNFIGHVSQINSWTTSWVDFFRRYRLAPQVAEARGAGRWPSRWNRALEMLYQRLDELLPEHPPASILHGDLWGGNFLISTTGQAALFDPAAYYGHREADLAMTELFGGFSRPFYEAYREAWPLEPGYDTRREIYNLYHLINHLNHFGGSYAGSVEAVLKRFA